MQKVIAKNEKSFMFTQPKPFYLIFFIEFWERFGFYATQGILAKFFVVSLGFSQEKSFATFGAFSALVYGLVVAGGYLGDKILGTKRTIVLGTIVLFIGYFMMAFSNSRTIFIALGVICTGNGLFKANPSSLLSKCYEKNDIRIQGAFTLYYMSINIGSFIALILSPTLASHFGWNKSFMLSGLGLVIALGNYLLMKNTISNIGSKGDFSKLHLKKLIIIIVAIIGVSFLCEFFFFLQHLIIAHTFLWIVTGLTLLCFFREMVKEVAINRKKMLVALVLMIEAIIFFTLYQQMPTSLNFFAISNVNHNFFGTNIDPQIFQSLNPFWIIVLSPLFAFLYGKYKKEGKDLAVTSKFALGMTLCGISFTLLYFAKFFSNSDGIVSAGWVVGSYFFQSAGELLISALGVAMVAELVPERIMGFIMGMWFLTTAIAGVTGGILASFMAISKSEVMDKVQSLNIYTNTFGEIGIITLIISIIMWSFVSKLNKYICEK
ncbi:oligopeptide:H+ symporter [uncultured Cetobacterium sp.]|uniref:oligopeptide:H+ symporter n=1 Tax=uncultured Cetobacterium sp. TaxID=527638 RepID=UPI00262BE331|nr:oligopeptide:H+ symporter [uncultured Cetobacterium sp.]